MSDGYSYDARVSPTRTATKTTKSTTPPTTGVVRGECIPRLPATKDKPTDILIEAA